MVSANSVLRYTVSVPKLTVDIVLRRLSNLYPDARCSLDWKTPLDLLVATILSAQCTDKRVNIVTASLFKKYRKPQDYLAVPLAELQHDIRSCGTFRMKALAIRQSCAAILERFGGRVPKSMQDMVSLRGVGRKTASVVLSTAYGIEEGIAVDTHVTRLSKLLGLTRHTAQAKIERDLMRKTPRNDWSRLSHLLIAHGRATNAARNPAAALAPFADLLGEAIRSPNRRKRARSRTGK
jgi:endonuclease-3